MREARRSVPPAALKKSCTPASYAYHITAGQEGSVRRACRGKQQEKGKMDIRIYTTPTCGYCHQARQFLDERGVRYTEYDVSRDRRAAEEMVSRTGQMGVPVIMVDGEIIVGFDRPRLEQLLARGARAGSPITLGISIADAAKAAQRQGAVAVAGALVGKVKPMHPGDRAGLQPGDIITELNTKAIRNAADLEHSMGTLKSGTRVTIGYIRGDQTRHAEVAL